MSTCQQAQNCEYWNALGHTSLANPASVVSDAAAAGIVSGSTVRMPQESTAAAQSCPQGDRHETLLAGRGSEPAMRWRCARPAQCVRRRRARPRRHTRPCENNRHTAAARQSIRGSRRWRSTPRAPQECTATAEALHDASRTRGSLARIPLAVQTKPCPGRSCTRKPAGGRRVRGSRRWRRARRA